ncbi:MAG: DUF3086 domain-containing protein, partial [Microcoleus sp. T1-bin1]|nr:DUF3086 domain-containing protein [Microcoleus sp. T1-bin1]
MNSDESPTQEPQAQPAAPSGDGEVDLPVNETEYQLLSQTQDLWIDQNDLQAPLPPETDPPLGEEDAELADFVAEAGALAQIGLNTDDGESESSIAQIDPPTDSQPTATAETVTRIAENVTEQLAERV